MKKILFWTLILIIAFLFVNATENPLTEQTVVRPSPVKNQVTERETMIVKATAYYGPVRGQNNYVRGSYEADVRLNGDGITKTGKQAEVGYIAADWSILPEGTRVYIPGYGQGTVEDIGGDIDNKRIDVFMGYGDEGLRKANEWGRRTVEIEIIEWGDR